MPTRPGRQKRPQGHAPTIRTSIRLTPASWDSAERAAAALGISRDAYIDALLERDGERLDARGRPKWWTRRTAPKWWVDPDRQQRLSLPASRPRDSSGEDSLTQIA